MIEKLILGTAGLGGQPYGLHGRQVTRADALAVVRYAHSLGIRTFDTAPSYGDAEAWLGETLDGHVAEIYTKTQGSIDEYIASMERLRRPAIKVLWHNWKDHVYLSFPVELSGVTVYTQDFKGHDHFHFRRDFLVQQNWNILNQDLIGGDHRIAVRSVFLQGLLTESGADGPEALRKPIARARRLAAVFGVDLPTLALRAALDHPRINSVVIGPTRLDELDQIVEIARRKPLYATEHLPLLDRVGAETDPRTWK